MNLKELDRLYDEMVERTKTLPCKFATELGLMHLERWKRVVIESVASSPSLDYDPCNVCKVEEPYPVHLTTGNDHDH